MTPLLLAFASAVLQTSPAGPAGWTAFTRHFDAHATRHHLVGASVSLVRDGATVARHHFGYADRATNRPVDDGTIFHWASVTKTLTAIAILQLRDGAGSRSTTGSRPGCRSSAGSTIPTA